MNNEIERPRSEVLSIPVLVLINKPVVVDSLFVLQSNIGPSESASNSRSKLFIYAPGLLEVKRSDALKKKDDSKVIPLKDVTLLIKGKRF